MVTNARFSSWSRVGETPWHLISLCHYRPDVHELNAFWTKLGRTLRLFSTVYASRNRLSHIAFLLKWTLHRRSPRGVEELPWSQMPHKLAIWNSLQFTTRKRRVRDAELRCLLPAIWIWPLLQNMSSKTCQHLAHLHVFSHFAIKCNVNNILSYHIAQYHI